MVFRSQAMEQASRYKCVVRNDEREVSDAVKSPPLSERLFSAEFRGFR